ncbi:Gluconokinase [Flagellimonas maritima]|uniref:Gluconokinase n=1 Tax=Flagellimonas maritima TaxID=1383885 RepID=A0A2Z4LXB4_9FLAO|nr:gluconokinase [Allomuricauda aurantiaca]AWX46363.1 Gluconokinase [Allomuricauda aurantiaca]
MLNTSKVFVVMGISGTGKSTVGKMLAKKLKINFYDGDDFHPKENIQKMSTGKALNDEDRHGWLVELNTLAKKQKFMGAVIACSALKQKYRDTLAQDMGTDLIFVHLEGSFELVKSRLENRKGHFMPVKLLQSQFDSLEPPKDAITVSVAENPDKILKAILKKLSISDKQSG